MLSKAPSMVHVTNIDGKMKIVFEKGHDYTNLVSPEYMSVEDQPIVTNYPNDSGEKNNDNS